MCVCWCLTVVRLWVDSLQTKVVSEETHGRVFSGSRPRSSSGTRSIFVRQHGGSFTLPAEDPEFKTKNTRAALKRYHKHKKHKRHSLFSQSLVSLQRVLPSLSVSVKTSTPAGSVSTAGDNG